MRAYGQTDTGCVRETNQDVFGIRFTGPGECVAFVCDGMGGPGGGEIASKAAADLLLSSLGDTELSLGDLRLRLPEIFMNINEKIKAIAKDNAKNEGMGTTLVAAFIKEDKALVANIGDSRVYHIDRSGINQVTKDHSVVQTLIDEGHISKSEGKGHPQKNIITRALGAYDNVQADFYDIDLTDGSMLLLCSDGLSNLVEEKEMQFELEMNDSLEQAADTLIEIAKRRGGSDNITAVIISRR